METFSQEVTTSVMNGTTSASGKALKVTPVVLMLTFGGAGNILALVRLLHNAKKHKWATFYRLVGALAVSDFIGLVGSLPISVNAYTHNKIWIGGQFLCDFMSFVLIFAGMASAMLACCMSIDRLIAVTVPFIYNQKLTKSKMSFVLLTIWLVAFLVACLPLMGVNANVKQFPGTWCFFNFFSTEPEDKFFAYFYAILGILMILIMIICNSVVVVSLFRRCRVNITRFNSKKSRVNDIYNIIFLIFLMIVFTVCWVPLCVRILINQSGMHEVDRKADLLVMRLALVNQIMDPWVYILLRKDIIAKIIKVGRKKNMMKTVFNQVRMDDEKTDDSCNNEHVSVSTISKNACNLDDERKDSNLVADI